MSEQEIIDIARSTPRESLPALIGTLAQATAEANARLLQPTPAKVAALDQMLTAKEASEILKVSPSWLYHQKSLPFAVLIPGSRSLKFSSNGIRKYLEHQTTGSR
jgi:hypothetical protein